MTPTEAARKVCPNWMSPEGDAHYRDVLKALEAQAQGVTSAAKTPHEMQGLANGLKPFRQVEQVLDYRGVKVDGALVMQADVSNLKELVLHASFWDGSGLAIKLRADGTWTTTGGQ